MSQKIILTPEQHEKAINSILNEILKDVDENTILNEGQIDEGLWTNVKYTLANLTGRYKAGGKIFGKGKVDAEAKAKIETILKNQANKAIVKLDNEIKETNPKFPNNKEPKDFLNTILAIAATYDTIVAATKKDPSDKEYLPVDAANAVINDLREYVKKFLDVDLKSVYSGLDEAAGDDIMELTEEELKELDEAWGLNETEEEIVNEEEEQKEPTEKDVRDKLKADRAARGGGKDFDSERMKTLKSNKLPLLLAGIGSSLGAFSWLVNTDWFKHLFDTPFNYTDTETTTELIQTKSEVFNDIKPGEGVYKLLGRVTDHPLDGNSSPSEFVAQLKELGGGDAHKGVDLLCQKGGVMMKPTEAAKGLHDLVNNPNQYETMNDMFKGGASGTGKLTPTDTTLYGTIGGRQLTSILVKSVPTIITKVAIKVGVKTGAGYAVAKGFGAVLGPIGIGLLTAGVLVKAMRLKGQKSSRAATLNALYQSLRNIEGGAIIEPEGPTGDEKKGGGKDGSGKGGDEKGGDGKGGVRGTVGDDDLYNSLLNLFRFIVTSEKKFGAGPGSQTVAQGNPEGGPQGGQKQSDNAEGGFKTGKTNNRDIEDIDFEDIPNEPASASSASGQRALPANKQQKGLPASKQQKSLPDRKSLSSLEEETEMLDEAKYFRDKELVKYLNKNVSPKRVKEFEDFMNRVEQIRNKIRNMKDGEDKVFNQKLATFKQNPIILTDFNKMLNISSTNPQAYQNLVKFINDIFSTVYSGKFKKGNLIDKLAGMGKVNVPDDKEAIDEKEQFKRTQIEKDAQDRSKFKKHLMQFLTDAIGLFQYMFQQRKNTAAQGGQQQNTNKQAQKLGIQPKPERKKAAASSDDSEAGAGPGGGASSQAAATESITNNNSLIKEEVERIKKLMGGLI